MDFVPDPPSAPQTPPQSGGVNFVPDKPLSQGSALAKVSNSWNNTRAQLARHEADLHQHWHTALSHPVESVLDVMSTPQRIVSGITENVQEHNDLHTSVNKLNDLVWHPTPQKVAKARQAVQQGLHIANDASIDTMVGQWNNWTHGKFKSLVPYVGNAFKTVNNIATDVITDPFAASSDIATGIRGTKAAASLANAPSAVNQMHHLAKAAVNNPAVAPMIHAGIKSGQMVMQHMHNALAQHGAGPAFAHLNNIVQNTQGAAKSIHNGLVNTFSTRPDLIHMGLTPDGRDVRLQLENGQRSLRYNDAKKDAGVINNANDSVQRYAEYVHLHGSPQRSANAKAILPQNMHTSNPPTRALTKTYSVPQIRNMSPDERAEMFKAMRGEIHDNELIRKSKDVFAQQQGKKLTAPGTQIDWGQYRTPNDSFFKDKYGIAKKAADMGRLGIELDPFPHGINNVGTLSYLGGGLDSVARGMAAMVKPVDHTITSRLNEMGAGAPEYTHSNHTGGIPGYAQFRNGASTVLQQMEHGWRAGMLSHLDEKLGPSAPGSKEELLKGALINRKLGDYKALSAFARAFSSFGGPFVAYHLSVLPKAVVDSIKENPLNYENMLRLHNQVQENREGHNQNDFSWSDPVEESAKGVQDPIGYTFNNSSLGLIKTAYDLYQGWSKPKEANHTASEMLLDALGSHIAPLGMAEDSLKNAEGKSFQGQPMSFADHVAAVMFGALSAHIHHKPSPKGEQMEDKFIRKRGFTYGY